MKRKTIFTRLASLTLALLLALTLAPSALAAGSMGNFQKIREYPGFSDVPADKWYADNVRQAYELGIINGKGNGKFDPEGNLTLAEAITMACQIQAIYFGSSFTPGGSPWYQNAVDFAIENDIIVPGEYSDYTALATRADVANLFYCIPSNEFPRINRISWISDVTPDTSYAGFIYMLYGAGVLTGSSSGDFQPNNLVTRAEAAAIINRVVLPENRVQISVATSAPGQAITGANGNFKLSVPEGQGWEVLTHELDEDGWCNFECIKLDESDPALFMLMAAPKSDLPNATLNDFAEVVLEIETEDGGQLYEGSPTSIMIRGLTGVYAHYTDADELDCEMYCVENSTQFYCVVLVTPENNTSDTYNEMFTILYSLDIAL